ncbi:hypothetical protein AAFC00_002190 [Neodothiora populina]
MVVVKPTGGSRQTRPFDPFELSRRLELYQQDQELATARRESARKAADSTRPAGDRNDSAHDDETKGCEDKDDSSDLTNYEEVDEVNPNAGEDKDEVQTQTQPQSQRRRPESSRQLTRPRADRKASSSRARRSQPGTYFPKYAAKQFSATTNTLPAKPASKSEKSKKPDSDPVSPKQPFVEPPMPKRMERVMASESDLDKFKDRRRSVMLPSTTDHNSNFAHSSRTSRPRPLSTALEHLSIADDQDANPYMLSTAPLPAEKTQLNDYSGATHYVALEPRPTLAQHHDHNRNDWSQASQCGDSTPHFSHHLHSIWKKDGGAAAGSDNARRPQHGETAAAPRRGTSAGTHGGSDQTMISDAVKLVKEERRRSSILGFLKRHH